MPPKAAQGPPDPLRNTFATASANAQLKLAHAQGLKPCVALPSRTIPRNVGSNVIKDNCMSINIEMCKINKCKFTEYVSEPHLNPSIGVSMKTPHTTPPSANARDFTRPPALQARLRRKQWIGPWFIGVAVLHTVFALWKFPLVLQSIASRGFIGTVGQDPMTAAVVWFALFGVVVLACGLMISAWERATTASIPQSVVWTLFVLGVVGVVLMPTSGFWLMFPPTIALLWTGKGRQDESPI